MSMVSFCKRRSSLPVADEKRVYKTIPTIVSAEASAIVKCRNGNNDDETDPKFRRKIKFRSEIQIKTFELAGFSMSRSAKGKHTYL